jgi:hypothetical protein
MKPLGFGAFLKKAGLATPEMRLDEYDEDEVIKEVEEANENKLEKFMDHEDDVTPFEICLVNKDNSGLFINAFVRNGEVNFGNVAVVEEDAYEIA